MIEIPIVNSSFMATIDDADYDLVSRHTWYLHDYKNGTMYAQTCTGLKMHCLLIPVVPDGHVRHHRDTNGLNNCRSNLEIRTNMENLQEKRIYRNNSSGYPGVKWNNASAKWEVQISVMGKRKYLGTFHSFDVAVEKRKEAERKYRNKGEEKD